MNWLANFCNWLQNTSLGLWVAGTIWGYPFVQALHFFGLSLWVGAILMLDLRLLGLTGKGQSIREFSNDLFPWEWVGLCILLPGGILLFSANAETYLMNPAFEVKIPLVIAGIAYHISVLLKTRKWDQPNETPSLAKVIGITELALWIGVITAAVNIPNY